jgi:hypothetical protein
VILASAKLRAELLASFGVLAFALTTVGGYSVTRSGPRARWSAWPFKDIPGDAVTQVLRPGAAGLRMTRRGEGGESLRQNL